MSIYTKQGDEGHSYLFGGERVKKDDIRLEAYGTIDELNCWLGLLLDNLTAEQKELTKLLVEVQTKLFSISSQLAAGSGSAPQLSQLKITNDDIARLEESIDKIADSLPPLRNFILPGGHRAVSIAHLARSVCRRAERRVVAVVGKYKVERTSLVYLNRLSDLLFMIGRYLSDYYGVPERKWQV